MNDQEQIGTENTQMKARAAFVKLIKEENFYSDFDKQSLKQHWNGAASGFANEMVQNRWHDFLAGWRAAVGATGNGGNTR